MAARKPDPSPVWAILATDGRHVLMGRYSAPTEDELEEAAAKIAAQGLRSWLVRIHGNRWARRVPQIENHRAMHSGLSDADWQAAIEAFGAEHRERVGALPP